jgi:hypothetical protein
MKMQEHNYNNKSDYVRKCAISPIEHDQKRMQKMLYEINKIGVNLNQIIRKMHVNNEIDSELVASVDCIFLQLNEVIKTYRKI